MLDYVDLKTISLRNHPELTEAWVEQRIIDNPSLLGFGKLDLVGKQRRQPSGGILDLMFQQGESKIYEVELQLGNTDESHIIRTIEYWDVESKRYPQYEHCAVLIAEEITGRFFNVIGLFNRAIPIIAMKVTAIQFNNSVGLHFTTILDESRRGGIDIGGESEESATRAYWEDRSTKEIMALTDELLGWIKEYDPDVQLGYVKSYVGLSRHGLVNNYIDFMPRKSFVRVGIRLPQTSETDEVLEATNLEWEFKYGRYYFKLTKEQATTHADVVRKLFALAEANAH